MYPEYSYTMDASNNPQKNSKVSNFSREDHARHFTGGAGSWYSKEQSFCVWMSGVDEEFFSFSAFYKASTLHDSYPVRYLLKPDLNV